MSSMDRETLSSLADAGIVFADGLVEWTRQYPDEADKSRALNIDDLLLRRRELVKTRAALEHRVSVGLFGESQCGKSMLVSRFGSAMGVAVDSDGNLLVRGSVEQGVGSADAPAGISFTRHLDPAASQESTGIACRFTTRHIEGVEEDRFLLELMSVSDLLVSLALGWKASQAEEAFDEQGIGEQLPKLLAELTRDEMLEDDDRDRVMVDFLEAWDYLRHHSVLNDSRLLQALDNGDDGWDEFVRWCVQEGRRPRLSTVRSGERAPIDRLAEMLWPGFEQLTTVWQRLFRARFQFRDSSSVTIAMEDACKKWDEDRLVRQSVIAVEWIRLLDPDMESAEAMQQGSQKVEIRGVSSSEGERNGHFLPIAEVVAMTRAIVLPLQQGVVSGDSPIEFDVLDFPGARAEEKSNRGVDAFLRGKLNCLFLGSTRSFDTNVLCLAAAADGNMEAAPVVRKAIDAWRRSKLQDNVSDKPMVVAITKADKLWEGQRDPAQGAKARLERLRGDYVSSSSRDWMSDGGPGGREFQRVFWVHNPDFASEEFRDGDRARRRFGEPAELFTKHSTGWRQGLDALFAGDGSDIGRLIEAVANLADGSDRTRALASILVDDVGKLQARLEGVYKPGGNIDARERAESDARHHVSALRKGHKHFALANLLRTVSWSQGRLESLLREAGEEATEHAMGIVEFDALYKRLLRAYRKEIDREIGREPVWFESLADESIRSQLQSRLKRLPEWESFKNAVRQAIEPRLQVNAQQMNSVAIASGIAMVWSRQMVWLGSPPRPRRDGSDLEAPLNIDLTVDSKATLDILQHWEAKLPEVYAAMDGQDQSGQPHNARLKTLLRPLRETVEAVRDHLASVAGDDASAGEALERIEELASRLQEPDLTNGGAE